MYRRKAKGWYKHIDLDVYKRQVPTVVEKDGKPVATIKPNDSVIFFNFRPDRAREMTHAFCDEQFDHFERANGFKMCIRDSVEGVRVFVKVKGDH